MSDTRPTPDQQAIIDCKTDNILVPAAAGSGKTTVMIERIINKIIEDISDDSIPDPEKHSLDSILVVTFTVAAAEHMREKAEIRLNEAIEKHKDNADLVAKLARQKELLPNSYIQTFDAFCARVVKEKGYCAADSAKADVFDPANVILDGNELTLLKHSAARQAIKALYAEAGTDADPFVRLTMRFGNGRDDSSLEQKACDIYDALRSLPDYLGLINKELNARKEADSKGELYCNDKICQVARDVILLLGKYKRAIFAKDGIYEFLSGNETFRICKEGDTKEDQNAASLALLNEIAALIDKQERRLEEPMTDGLAELYRIRSEWKETGIDILSPMTKSNTELRDDEALNNAYKAMVAPVRAIAVLTVRKWKSVDHVCNPPKSIMAFMDLIENCESLEELKAEQLELQKRRTEMIGAFVQLITRMDDYSAKLKTIVHGMDFADQEFAAYDILSHEDAIDFYRNKFVEIYIDEYQDNTVLQDDIIAKIARGSGNVFRVGDVKQSIYKFRHAEPKIFTDKIDAYIAGTEKGQVLPLTENFRSSPQILAFVNHIFEQEMTREGAEIEYDANQRLNHPESSPSGDQGEEGLPRVVIVNADGAGSFEDTEADPDDDSEGNGSFSPSDSFEDEAQPLDSKFKALCLGVEKEVRRYMSQFDPEAEDYASHYEDICILTSIRNEAEELVRYLEGHGLPATGRVTTSVFNDLDIRGVIGFIICLGNSLRDEYLAGVLLSPYKNTNFTINDLAEVQAYIKENRPHLQGEHLMSRLKIYAAEDKGILAERIQTFIDDYEDLRMKALTCDIDEIVELIFKRTEIKATVKRKAGDFNKLIILKDWLCNNFKRFGCDISGISEELEDMKIQINEKASIETNLRERNKIVCMNLHKSKGLEFPCVIFALKDREKSNSIERFSYDAHDGFILEDYDEETLARKDSLDVCAYRIDRYLADNAETLRDLYVALTRAKTRLSVVTWDGFDHKNSKAMSTAVQVAALCDSDTFTRIDWLWGSGTMCCAFLMALVRTDSEDAARIRACVGTDIDHLLGFKACTTKKDQDPGVLPGNRGFIAEILSEEETKALDAEFSVYAVTPEDPDDEDKNEDLLFDERGRKTFAGYEYEDETLIPFKVSVTGIRHGSMEETRHVDLEVRDASEYDNTGSGALNAAAKGTILHKLMRFIDTEALRNGANLIAETDKLIAMKMFDEYSADNVRKTAEEFRDGIMTFVSSDICKAFEQAADEGRSECEKPIVFAVPAADKSSDFALVQGKIDLLYEDGDGWIILDYKTERSDMPDAESRAAEAREKHGFQLSSYSAALEASGMKVKARYVYLVRFGEFVPV